MSSSEVVAAKKAVISTAEQEELLEDICNDVLGYGPLQPLLANDDITDIMVNGSNPIFIEIHGKVQQTDIRFRDNTQLLNVCQRIVSQVGRRVDKSSPICDARLPDGSRVNVIAPPLAIDGAIAHHPQVQARQAHARPAHRVRRDLAGGRADPEDHRHGPLQHRDLGRHGLRQDDAAQLPDDFIEPDERIVTCEDTAELQLQQPHVVRLETRPANLEGAAQVTMRDLVKNCLRMRPDRIVVGEVPRPRGLRSACRR